MHRLRAAFAGVAGLALVLSALWSLGNAGQVYACSCLPPDSPLEELEKADAVFAGRVVLLQEIPDKPDAYYFRMVVGLEVSTVWKGPAHELTYVRTSRGEASCGFTFEYGRRYLVYAYEYAEGYETDLCSRTAGLWAADADLEELGEGRAPELGTIAPLTQDLVGIVGSVIATTPTAEPAPTPTSRPTPEPEGPENPEGVGLWLVVLAVVATVLAMGGLAAFAWMRR